MALALVVTTLASLLAPPVLAQQESADAARLYKEGWRLYEQKQYAEACPLLERSLAASATIRTRGALALCYESAGRLASAYRTWKAVADQAREAGAVEQPRLKRAVEKMEEILPKLARVVFQVVDARPGEQVTLDAQPLAASDLGVALPLDPGRHVVAAKAPDRADWSSTFELGKSDLGKTKGVDVGPLAPIEPIETKPPGPPRPTTTPVAAERPPAEPTTRTPPLKYVGLATAGAGVVAITVGTIFALSAKSTWDDAKSMGCDDKGVCKTQAAANLVNDAGSKATIATVAIPVGIALVAGGAALWFLTPTERITPSVAVGPGGAQLGLRGSF